MYGTPGPVYVDLPGDLLLAKAEISEINWLPIVDPYPALVMP